MTRKSKKRTGCLKALILLPFMDLPSSLPGKTDNPRKRKITRMRAEAEAIPMKLVKKESKDDSDDSDSENGDSEE